MVYYIFCNTREDFKNCCCLYPIMKKVPKLQVRENGPYIARDIDSFNNSKGEKVPVKPVMALCRCGGSNNKPFCDGTHGKINFKGGKLPGQVTGDRKEYKRGEITVSDNPGICSHAGFCDGTLPELFWDFIDGKRVPKKKEVDTKKAIKTIKLCPSGALAYKLKGKIYDKIGRKTAINIRKDGPYDVVGEPKLEEKPDSTEHFSLCRCGGSKNKPFCDGTHRSFFKDDKN